MKQLIRILILSNLFFSVGVVNAEVTVYGRVIYNIVSDDTSDDIYFGRHEFAESTFGVKGSHAYEGVTFGAQIEIGLDEGVSNLLQNDSNARNRIQELWVDSKYGKVKLGTGPGITWIISDVDQSGTWWSDPLGNSQRFGSTRRGPAGQSQTPFVQSQSLFLERLIYESPEVLPGGKLYAQLSEDSGYELAAKYVSNGWRVNAWTVDYGDGDNDEDPQANIDGNDGTLGFFGAERGRGVLAGYLHSSGVNFTATYGYASLFDDSERDFVNAKLGYTQGKHAFSVSVGDYGGEDATGTATADHTRTTVAYHFIPVSGVRLWIQATEGDTDNEENFNAIALGGLIKF